jgi:hypothetical protein
VGPAAAALTRLLVAGLAALLLPVLSAGPASACSCAQISTAESVAGSDAVFLAVAGPGDQVTVREVFAGMLPSRLEVREAPGDPCPAGLVDAQRYVVFATWHRDRQEYSTSPCSGTARATAALVADVEAVTGPGRPPYDVPGGLPDDSGEHGLGTLGPRAWTLVAGSAAVLLLLGCVGVLVVRADRANR